MLVLKGQRWLRIAMLTRNFLLISLGMVVKFTLSAAMLKVLAATSFLMVMMTLSLEMRKLIELLVIWLSLPTMTFLKALRLIICVLGRVAIWVVLARL